MKSESFHRLQAEAFIDWFNRLEGNPDLHYYFDFWADSKDFSAEDRSAIKAILEDLLQRDKWQTA